MAVLNRWDPVRDLMSIQNEMNRLFGRTYGQTDADEFVGSWSPSIDVFQSDDKFTVVCELPGLTTEDIDITVEDNILTVRGERKFYEDVKEENFHRVERRYGGFIRRIALPQHSDTGSIQASMSEGLLRIEIPKAEQAKPKKIQVQTHTPNGQTQQAEVTSK